MDQCERSPIALTANEKKMVLSVYNYIHSLEIINLRKEVSLATGVGKATVARVLAEFNKTGAVIASEQGHRSSRTLKADYIKAIQDLILTANKNGIPLSLRMLVLDLTELGFPVSKAQLARHLKKLGYRYGKGEWQNILLESPENVAYRARYLRWRFENIQDKNEMPIFPEVFLDESYCHMHHNRNLTWLPKDGIVYEKGRGPMLVIFGAIVIFQDRNNNQIKDELVRQ